MGTEISLDVSGVGVTWSKNSMGIDHGSLCQVCDRKRIPDPEHENDEEVDSAFEMGFQRNLGSTVARLELLGYTMNTVLDHYSRAVIECRYEREMMNLYDSESVQSTTFMSFEEFLSFVSEHPLSELSNEFTFDSDAPKRQTIGRFNDEERMVLLPFYDEYEIGYSERNHFVQLLGV